MITVALGLSGALLFGASDFIGGIGARVASPLKITAASAATGLVLLGAAVLALGGTWSTEAVALGLLSGLAAGGALALLYASLAIGPMSILSPITGMLAALVPMTVGLVRGESLGAIGHVALALALVAAFVIGFSPERHVQRPSGKGLATAIGAGLLFGIFLVLIDLTPDDSGLIPLVFSRMTTAALMGIALLAMVITRRPRIRLEPALQPVPQRMSRLLDGPQTPSWRVGLRFGIVCGCIDAVANTLQLLGLRSGELSVMSVLNSMYPAGTILLAALVARERISRLQFLGLALALTASAMFALA